MKKTYYAYAMLALLTSNLLVAYEIDNAHLPAINPKTENVDYLNQQWYLGKKEEIYAIAKMRLKINKNDLASILVMFNYVAEDANFEEFLAQLKNIEENASIIENSEKRNNLLSDVKFMKMTSAQIPNVEKLQNASKLHINGKEFSSIDYLRCIETEGKFEKLTKMEVDYIEGRIHREEFLAESNVKLGNAKIEAAKKMVLENKAAPDNLSREKIYIWLYVFLGGMFFVLAGGGILWRWRFKK